MGYLVGKDIFRELGRKIDGLHSILKELYTAEEADVIITMSCGLSTFAELERVTGYEKSALQRILVHVC